MHTPGLRLAMPAHGLRRLPPAAPGADPARPGGLHRAQGALRDEGGGRPRRAAARVGQGGGPPRGRRPGDGHLFAAGALRAARRPRNWRGRASRPPSSTCAPSTRSTSRRSAPRWSGWARRWSSREGPMTAGVAAELAARISEECFDYLEDPVIRVAGEDIPISVSVELETGSVPGAGAGP